MLFFLKEGLVLKEKFAQEATEILIDIGAVSISVEKPFTLTSGKKPCLCRLWKNYFISKRTKETYENGFADSTKSCFI